MDVATLAELLDETAEHHDLYEKTAPKHDWWDWYAPTSTPASTAAHPRRHPQSPACTWRKSDMSTEEMSSAEQLQAPSQTAAMPSGTK